MAKARICATLVALALSALPLAAHHGWSNYGTEEFTLTGAVDTSVSYAGPHATYAMTAAGPSSAATAAGSAKTPAPTARFTALAPSAKGPIARSSPSFGRVLPTDAEEAAAITRI